ncbi:MAG: MG2 domain-containing protein, partial [Planctomyces sp.]
MQRIFSAACWTVLVVSLHLTGIADRTGVTMADERADHRKQATRLFNEGQFAESLTLYQQLALDPQNPDRELPGDFAQSVRCLQQLGRISEFDSFIENVIKVHSEQWRLLLRASQMLSGEVETGGFLVGGQFERGHHRGGGEWADASERDRVRALQLLLQAVPLAEKDELATAAEKSDVYRQLANAIGMQRHGNAWKLQDLTDTTTLPDYSTSNPSPYGRGRRGRGFPGWGAEDKGAPVDADGNPVFHQMPTSWDAAKSDGERWRWALSQVVEKDASRQSEVDLEWAAFLNSQFGVREGFRDIILPASVAKDGASDASNTTTPEPADTHAAHRLPDDETIARLASGVRRFRLPDEFNPIVIFNRIVARGDASKRNAQESLIGIRMGRHQYPQAVEILRSLHEAATDKDDRANLQSRIDQIVKNWVQVDSVRVQPAGKGAVLNIRYRNGSQVNFEASEINIDQLLTDVKAYLQSRPKELNYERLQIENIGYLLLNQDRSRYLAKPSATWSAALKPPEGHFDATESVTTPLQKAGAWWVTAKMQDGNETRIVVWVADTAISRKRVEGGTMYFVADAATGTPVSKANLEFFGWNQQYNQEGRIHQINTTRFAAVTDENGISVPDASQLNSNFQWLTIAKTKEGRLAYEGFSGIWNPERLSDLDYSPVKVYSITDRPVYRPGHDVKFRLWIRQPRFHEDDARFDNKDYVIQIRNPRGDKVYETPARTDRWAGIDGEWKIPADGVLGDYVLAVCETANPDVSVIGNGSFRVEEYRKPEFEVKVDAPDKPVKLGEKIQAKINAKYY